MSVRRCIPLLLGLFVALGVGPAEGAANLVSVGLSVGLGGVPPGFPDALSTGPVDESKIPPVASGRVESAFDGQVLENFHAESLVIKHDDVVVRNFRVTRANPDAWFAVAILDHAVSGGDATGTVFEDGEITSRDAAGNPQPSRSVGINGSFFRASRLDISYMEDGIAGREYVVEDSFIHDLVRDGSAHNDGIASYGGDNIVIRHNTVLMPDQQTGTVSMFTDNKPIDQVMIEGNYLNGGSYTLYSDDKGHGAPSSVTITGNVFGRDYLYGILHADGDPTWTNNTWADTGETFVPGDDSPPPPPPPQPPPPVTCQGIPATIVGTSAGDDLTGTSGDDVIVGGGGADTIDGVGGDDIICGGAGADVLDGGTGSDLLIGGSGADVLRGNRGSDDLRGHRGRDNLVGGKGADDLRGGGGADVLLAGKGNDHADGQAGADTIRGGSAGDVLLGGPGRDSIYGNGGNDELNGQSGWDELHGGSGIDVCTKGESKTGCEAIG